jgi:hypothetical protein
MDYHMLMLFLKNNFVIELKIFNAFRLFMFFFSNKKRIIQIKNILPFQQNRSEKYGKSR